jgi:hypothetical protein
MSDGLRLGAQVMSGRMGDYSIRGPGDPSVTFTVTTTITQASIADVIGL